MSGMKDIKIYIRIARGMAQLVGLIRLYDFKHPIVQDKLKSVHKEITNFIDTNKKSIILAKSADAFFLNGERIEPDDKLTSKFIEEFFNLQLGSVELEAGVSAEEFSFFIWTMSGKEHMSGADKVKQFLSDKKVVHIIVRAATFKLVQENEDIIKKGEFIKIEELPAQIFEKFSKDFNDGKVSEKLNAEDKNYKTVAHNSSFLAGLLSDSVEDKNITQDLEKALWLLADYLINEIGTAKQEDINRKILEDVKDKLFSMWQDKPEKKPILQDMEKTYVAINAALQLKGLVLLYKKHKKELETTFDKIRAILQKLPTDSQLYQKTKLELEDIGLLKQNIFL